MAGTLQGRKENRIAARVFVELDSLVNAGYELTNTIDVSRHGARVVSQTAWVPDQRVSVRAIRGQLDSRARVVYCQRSPEQGYVIGLELSQPAEGWPETAKAFKASPGK